eukprot:scaffold2987_cov170-Amphora_coffeaeformis.AAC.14
MSTERFNRGNSTVTRQSRCESWSIYHRQHNTDRSTIDNLLGSTTTEEEVESSLKVTLII